MHKYNSQQHREYINLTRKIGGDWVEIFEGNTDFYSAHYWDLLTEMWYADRPLMVSDALKFMRSIKSPFTARKYLQKVIDSGMIIESKNPADERSMLMTLAPDVRTKLDSFFDRTIANMESSTESIKGKA